MSYHVSCRVCGELTRHQGRSLEGKISCDKPECLAESRRRKNEAISQAQLRRYANDPRPRTNRWKTVPRVSVIEKEIIGPHLLPNGWISQHTLKTGLKGLRVPRIYYLDFAFVEKRLCLEIDGRSHRGQRFELDQRRDDILSDLGWKTLRFTNEEVISNLDEVLRKINDFVAGNPIVVEPPQLCKNCGLPMPRSKRKSCSQKCANTLQAEAIRGRTVARKRRETVKRDSRGVAIVERNWVPCRICGGSTKLNGTTSHPRYHTTSCDKPECREESKRITRQNQSAALKLSKN